MFTLRPRIIAWLAWLLAGILLFISCGSPPLASSPATPQAVILTFPPEVRPYADSLAACARKYPEIALYLNETVEELTPDEHASLFLAPSRPPIALSGWHATLLANDSLAVIVNQQNRVTSLTSSELHAIWSGLTTNWQALEGSEAEIQVWTYPFGRPLRQLFDSAILAGELTTSRAWLAPDPQAMLEAVSAEPGAIGYLPDSWLDAAPSELANSIRLLSLPEDLEENLHQPVIALTEAEPQGALRTLLLCSQSR